MAHLTDWAKRIKITIDHTKISSDVTHFPIAIVLGTSSGIGDADISCVFDEVGSNSKKIAVTKDDGITQIYVEIELWDAVAEKAVLWASKSDLVLTTSADTVLYLYYDVAKPDNTTYVGVTGDTPAKSVWDSSYKRVYHMSQDPSGGANSIKDSTSNVSNATPAGTMTSADLINSAPGKGLDLDGSDDELQFSAYTVGSAITVEAVVLFNAVYRQHVAMQGDGTNLFDFWLGTGSSNQGLFGLKNTTQEVSSGAALSTGVQYFLAGSYDASWIRFYLNGAAATPVARTVNPPNNGVFRTGVWYNNKAFGGHSTLVISELRLSSSARSAAWILANNYSITDSLITFGAEEVTSVTDFSLDLAVHANAFDYFKMILQVAGDDWIEDFKLNVSVVAQVIESFRLRLEVVLNKIDDFKLLLEVTDGTVFDNFKIFLDVVDGTVFDNFRMELSVISATPAFRSVTAQRVSSVLHEVV